MEKDQAAKFPPPPYVPYRTLANFLDRFKQGVPGRIDTGLMASMSGGTRNQLLSSMRTFKLISDVGIPTEDMKRLCALEGADRQKILKGLIIQCYPYIFGDDFEFSTATGSLLREAIENNTKASGETVTRCVLFLRDAAEDAGIPVSPFLKDQKPRGSKPKKNGNRKQEPSTVERGAEPVVQLSAENRRPTIPAESSLLLWGLFQRLPKPGTPWTAADREQWTQTLKNVLTLEYPDQP